MSYIALNRPAVHTPEGSVMVIPDNSRFAPTAAYFRYMVVRVAGVSIDSLERLTVPGTVEAADDLLSRMADLRAKSRSLSDRLHSLVPHQPPSVRRRLLRLRRDLFNLRVTRAADIDSIPDRALREDVETQVRACLALDELREGYGQSYAYAVATARTSLKAVLANDDLAAGIRLSSRTLSDELMNLRADPPRGGGPKTERAFLRYLTRAAAKATPFGRFCAILPGVIEPASEHVLLDADPVHKWSRIRSNKRLMSAVLDHLLADDDARCQLPLRLNPTLSVSEGSLSFLASFGTREAFQSLERNDALDAVFETLRLHGSGTVRSLAREVVTRKDVDATSEEAELYVDKLFSVGMLQLDLPGIGHDPEWPRRLLHLVAPIRASQAADGAREFLTTLADGVDRIRREGLVVTASGCDALDELERSTTAALSDWSSRNGRTIPAPLVYEDASARGAVRIDPEHFGEALRRVEELLGLVAPLTWERAAQRTMYRFFTQRFGSSRVPLLTFYETYYREHVKPSQQAFGQRKRDAGARDEPQSNGPNRESIGNKPPRSPAHQFRALVERYRARQPGAREISLSRDDVEEIVASVPPLPDEPRSVSLFVNWVPRPGHPYGGLIVLPHLSTQLGFGKYFSRFLYLLPDEVLEALRATLPACENLVLAEIAGDQAFNANLRPPIQRCEILYPTGDRIGCAETIDVGELDVGPGNRGERLDLYQRGTERRIVPLDLGFLNPRMRPPLYQLLRQFSPAVSTQLGLRPRAMRRAPPRPDGPRQPVSSVEHDPRITYEDAVVLARESWTMPPEGLPRQQSREKDADFFLRVHEWRTRLRLPDRVYVSCTIARSALAAAAPAPDDEAKIEESNGDPGGTTGTAATAMDAEELGAGTGSRGWADLRKPQYLDFRSPLVPQLLHRYRTLDDRFAVTIEECLPAPEHLPVARNGERFVTESIVQLDLSSSISMTRARRIEPGEVVHGQ